MPAENYEDLRETLAQFQQSHLLAFWDELDDRQRSGLLAQLDAVDFQQMQSLLAADETSSDWEAMAARAESPSAIRLEGPNPISEPEARLAGEEAFRGG